MEKCSKETRKKTVTVTLFSLQIISRACAANLSFCLVTNFWFISSTSTPKYSYHKVPYGPLTEELARKCLRTLSQKMHVALKELHDYGIYTYNDFHLPNVCFNSAYDVVMERCESKTWSLLANKLGELSYMYTKPETLTGDFTAKVLDYIELGWILAWVLNDEADDYRKRNIGKTRVLKFKVTLSCLNLSSTVYILTSDVKSHH